MSEGGSYHPFLYFRQTVKSFLELVPGAKIQKMRRSNGCQVNAKDKATMENLASSIVALAQYMNMLRARITILDNGAPDITIICKECQKTSIEDCPNAYKKCKWI